MKEATMLNRVRAWLHGQDRLVDELINANRARRRPEMESIDWRKMNAAGQRRWQEMLRGQRRTHQPEETIVSFRSGSR